METKVIITGSFDPITAGHADVIRRAAAVFDTVYVVVFNNEDKKHFFSQHQRFDMLKAVCNELAGDGITNVIADSCSGMTADYMREHGISVIVRGVRGESDYTYEYELANIMKRLLPGCETILIPSGSEYLDISSTYVRERISSGESIKGFVTPATEALIQLFK